VKDVFEQFLPGPGRRILERNYGTSALNEIFVWVDHTPIASGSIAQIHRAKLKAGAYTRPHLFST